LPSLDRDIAGHIEAALKRDGVSVITSARPAGLKREGDAFAAALSNGGQVMAEAMLVCVGRRPNGDGIGLAEVGAKTDGSGCIKTDEFLACGEGAYAIGDVKGGMLLAHAASYEGICVVDTILSGTGRRPDYNKVPYCIYTDPEVASVGPAEEELKRRGGAVTSAKIPYMVAGRAHTAGRGDGE